MRIMNPFFLIPFWFAICAYSQAGVYLSSDDIEEISDPERIANTSFLYRVGEKADSLRFYRVFMSNMLYGTKNTFQWPADLEGAQRYRLPLFNSREATRKKQMISEMIFNDRLVLSSDDSLYYLKGGDVVPLKRIPGPGIAFITSSPGASYLKLDAKGGLVEKSLPAFYYTLNDTTQICFIRADTKLSIELNPYTPLGQFRIENIVLSPYPEVHLPARPVLELPAKAEVDSAGLRGVDSLTAVLQTWIAEDSLHINQFVDSVQKQLVTQISKTKYETDQAYIRRADSYKQEARLLLQKIATWNRVDQLLFPLQQKRNIFQSYRKQQAINLANEEFKRTQDFRTQLLNHHLWNRLFASAYWTIGRNMDQSFANPSPTMLSGGGVRLDWIGRLYRKTSLITHLEGSLSAWRFQEQENRFSTQKSGVLAFEIGIPVGIAPAGNYTLDTTSGLVIQVSAGPALALRNTELVRNSGAESKKTYAIGGAGSLSLFFAGMPIIVSLDYSYFNDKLGDFALRVGIPLYRREAK